MAISFCLHFSAMFHGPLWIDIFVAGGMQPGLKKLGILYFYQCEPYTFQPRPKKKKKKVIEQMTLDKLYHDSHT